MILASKRKPRILHHSQSILLLLFFWPIAIVSIAQDQPDSSRREVPIPIYVTDKEDGLYGLTKSDCANFSYSKDEKFLGVNSLHLQWDEDDAACLAPELGFKFATINVFPYLQNRALTFYVKSTTETLESLPLTFILEDRYRDQTRASFNKMGLFGKKVGKEWTKVAVPLKNFDFSLSGGDPTDIVELIVLFEGVGDIFISKIVIEPFEDPYEKAKEKLPSTEELVALPRILFADELRNGWSIGTPFCSNFSVSTAEKHQGNASIRINMANYPAVCDWSEFGFSWTGWEAVNLTKIHNMSALQFYIKSVVATRQFEVQIAFEDYSGNRSAVRLDNIYLEEHSVKANWQLVRIPLLAFDFQRRGIDVATIKQIVFIVGDQMHCFIDQIEIVEFRGSPDRPFLH